MEGDGLFYIGIVILTVYIASDIVYTLVEKYRYRNYLMVSQNFLNQYGQACVKLGYILTPDATLSLAKALEIAQAEIDNLMVVTKGAPGPLDYFNDGALDQHVSYEWHRRMMTNDGERR